MDDDSLLRTALGRLLRGAGFRVTTFERPSDVLASLLPKTNACLILDVYMQDMSGPDLWKDLRASGVELPTILITGQRDGRADIYGKQVGAVAVLFKPIEEKELFETVERALLEARR